jgi:coniferyl-aldehyde dehydrogenase
MNNNLRDIFDVQYRASRDEEAPDYYARMQTLDKLLHLTQRHESEINEAMHADFGNRSAVESMLGDIIMVLANIKDSKKRLRAWMRPRRVKIAVQYWPGKGRIENQPLGVVGVISPWNYPYHMAMVPAVQALAAGNRVMIKPSELTPKTSALMARLIADNFDPDLLTVVNGGAEVGQAFAELPFDHLFFTGSTSIGRKIAAAAAPNLTPVTLELGGKSPTIIGKRALLKLVVPRIAFGKFLNGGQTCIAPDYMLVPRAQMDEFVDLMKETVRGFYPNGTGHEDYTSIITDRHFDRLARLAEDAKTGGAEIVSLLGDEEFAKSNQRKFPPALVLDPSDDLLVMQEEIFGPILPVKPYDTIDQAIAYINAHDRPLALYYFGEDKKEQRNVLDRTVSGGVCINDAMIQVAQENLPFGGVGPSGMGSYHGEWGFRQFSKEKPVFTQSRFSAASQLYPPYGAKARRVIKFVKKLL